MHQNSEQHLRCSARCLFFLKTAFFLYRCGREHISQDLSAQQRNIATNLPWVHWPTRTRTKHFWTQEQPLSFTQGRTQTQFTWVMANLYSLPTLEQGHKLKLRLDTRKLKQLPALLRGSWKLCSFVNDKRMSLSTWEHNFFCCNLSICQIMQ